MFPIKTKEHKMKTKEAETDEICSPLYANIIKQTRQKKWYKEDLFSRFYLISDKIISLKT